MTPAPPLQAMAIFAHVVEAGGFTGAAQHLGVSKSAVSKAVAGLEEHLGVRLLLRTTRKVRLTDAGERLYASCQRILAEAERAEHEVGSTHGRPRGTLRVNAPVVLGRRFVLPMALDFMAQYPEVEVDLTLQDDYVDLIATKTDVAVRVGRLVDSSLVMRHLAPARANLVASPSYLARRGLPETPEALSTHALLLYTLVARPDHLHLERGGERVTVRMHGALKTNNGEAIRDAAVAGHGVAALPDFIVDDALAAGALVRLLPDWTVAPESSIYAVYAQSGPVTPQVRLFINALVAAATTLRPPDPPALAPRRDVQAGNPPEENAR